MRYIYIFFFLFIDCKSDDRFGKLKIKKLNIDCVDDKDSKKEDVQSNIMIDSNKSQGKKEKSLSTLRKSLASEFSKGINSNYEVKKYDINEQVCQVDQIDLDKERELKVINNFEKVDQTEVLDSDDKISEEKRADEFVWGKKIEQPDDVIKIDTINGSDKNENIVKINEIEGPKSHITDDIDDLEKTCNETISYLDRIKGDKSTLKILNIIKDKISCIVRMCTVVQIKQSFIEKLLIRLIDRLPKERPRKYELYVNPIKQIINADKDNLGNYKKFAEKAFEEKLKKQYGKDKKNVYKYKEIF